MDKISILGIILGLAAILVGQVLEGGNLHSLLQITAFMIVIGGTVGAVMLQSQGKQFLTGLRMAAWVFVPPAMDFRKVLNTLTGWSQQARRNGLLALEAYMNSEKDPFVKRGLTMVVDGAEPEMVLQAMQLDIDAYEEQARAAARIWESRVQSLGKI